MYMYMHMRMYMHATLPNEMQLLSGPLHSPLPPSAAMMLSPPLFWNVWKSLLTLITRTPFVRYRLLHAIADSGKHINSPSPSLTSRVCPPPDRDHASHTPSHANSPRSTDPITHILQNHTILIVFSIPSHTPIDCIKIGV